jgi:hypothetical protein
MVVVKGGRMIEGDCMVEEMDGMIAEDHML